MGLAVAVVGWAVDTQTEVVSDVRELVPRDLQALKDVNELQEETGVSGEIDVTVRADDITRPEVLAWMTEFQQGALRAAGYRPGATCRQERNPPELCPALSLPDIFRSVDPRNQQQVNALLDAVPAYFSQGVVTEDRRTANLAFGIRLQSLEDQKEVVDDLKARLDPPEGVEASVVGLPVLAAEANGALASPWRRGLMLVGALIAVFLVLLAVRRSRREAAVPLIPDRARDRLVGRGAVRARAVARPARGRVEPDVDHPGRARRGDLDRVQRAAVRALPPGARGGRGPDAGHRAHLRVDRRRGAGLRGDRHRRLRRAGGLGHPHAARFRHRHGRGPDGVADRRDARASGRPGVGGAARSVQPARPGSRGGCCRRSGCRAARVPSAGHGAEPPERPDDPFADLGAEEAGRRRRKAIGDRLAERDRVAPEPVDRKPEVPRPGNKYAWVVGIVMLMGIAVLLLTTALPNTGEGIRGPQPGELLRPFAAPLATSNVDDEADANVCQVEPCPESAGPVPACEVRSELVLNLCELRQRPLVLTFMVTAGADCEPQVDRVERIRDEFPGLQFAVVMSGNDRSEAEAIVERRGWRQPVGVDKDGAVVNIYGIGICPVTVFALPGGIVFETEPREPHRERVAAEGRPARAADGHRAAARRAPARVRGRERVPGRAVRGGGGPGPGM